MNSLASRLLGLDGDTLRMGEEGVRLGFERPMPGWLWIGILALLGAYALWSYMRLTGSLWGRSALACVRWCTLSLLLVLIAGPQLVERIERVEPDWVLVLLDRSQSMQVADAPAGEFESGRVTRDEQLTRAIAQSSDMWETLAQDRTLVWLGFDSGAYDMQPDLDFLALPEPDGRRTSLAGAMEQALRKAAARPLASVVVFSDGRSIDEPSRATLRRLQSERIPVHVAPLGSERPIGDLAVRAVDAPRSAFVDDLTPVAARIERVGDAPLGGAAVRLVDTATGQTLDEQPLSAVEFDESGAATVTLLHRAVDPGETPLRVEISQPDPDLIPANDETQVVMDFVDRPMRVLYVDGYPRWEQRYLKNLLLRERSVVSSNLLLAPDRSYLQEGDVELTRMPTSPEEWAEYDVVVIGDVHPEVFSPEQLSNLREHVATRGAGILWVGGPGATPGAWRSTALADLVPFTISAQQATATTTPVLVSPSPIAASQGVLRLGPNVQQPWPEELEDPATGWSALRWWQRIEPGAMKPASQALAYASPAADPSSGSWPLVLSMRFGAGRSIYVGTDEIWRWRYGRGEQLPERFWLQLVRLLGRESLARSGKQAILRVTPRRAVAGEPVRVVVELLDQSLLDANLNELRVRFARRAEPGDLDGAIETTLTLRREAAGSRTYAATWLPDLAGEWTVASAESLLAGLGLEEHVTVGRPDDEMRRPEADHALLARLAEQTGGAVIAPEDAGALVDLIPNRQRRTVNERTEPLWDAPLALVLLVGLLTIEWVGRRMIRLI